MTSILNKNAVLTGAVDSLCLVCEDHLRGDEDALVHIVKPIHKKNLDATSFFDKYKDDHVRKVKKGYYCEYCNVFLKTSAKVGPHVAEARHFCKRKASKPLKREGNCVIAFEKVLIPENARHGLTKGMLCSLCDAEFDDALLHKTEKAHILNLVLAEIEVADGNVYRKVDDSTFQCLTCNVVLAISDMTGHFDGANHKKQYQDCCDSAEKIINPKKEIIESAKEDNQNKKPEIGTPKDKTPKSDTLEAVKEDKQNKTSEKEISEDDTTEKTAEVVNVDINECSAEQTSISLVTSPVNANGNADKPKQEKEEESKQDIDKECSQYSEVEAENYAKENNLVYNKERNTAFRPVCLTNVPEALINMKEHIEGVSHKNNVAQPKVKPDKTVVTKVPTHPFIDNTVTADKPKQENDEESKQDKDKESSQVSKVEEENYAKENNLVYNKERNTAFCPVCVTKVPPALQNMKEHIKGVSHKKKVAQTRVKPVKTVVTKVRTHKFIGNTVTADKTKQGKVEESKQDKDKEPNQDSTVEVENYAKENNLVYNKEANTAFCPVCVTKVPPALQNMKEHIKGVGHKKKVAQTRVKPVKTVVTKVRTHKFIGNTVTADKTKQGKVEESKQDKDKEPSQDSTVEVENYAKENNLVYNKEANTAFCPGCDTKVTPALKNMKKHIDGVSHKNNLTQLKLKPVKTVVTVPAHQFIDFVLIINNNDAIINEKYLLNILSFFMITKMGSKLRCHGCEVNLTPSQIDAHENTVNHIKIMNETPVVSSEDSEFIREIRPKVYHCGFCNQLESPWPSMESHLKSTLHHGLKIRAYLSLQDHLPDIMEHRLLRVRRAMQFMMFRGMSFNRMF